jgi:hypothetical protein
LAGCKEPELITHYGFRSYTVPSQGKGVISYREFCQFDTLSGGDDNEKEEGEASPGQQVIVIIFANSASHSPTYWICAGALPIRLGISLF